MSDSDSSKYNKMKLIWNEFDLKQPPLTTISVKDPKLDIPNLRRTLDDALAFYETQTEFEESAALCSRIIARRKNSFRTMNGFKSFCKLNTALCRLLRLDIKEVLRNFLGLMPEYAMKVGFATELPSCENLDYVLIRLIGFHKIFVRIFACCDQVACYFSKILRNNFFVDITILILAITSNIWKLSFKICNRTYKLYETMLGNRSHFPQRKKSCMYSKFEFPKKLEQMPDENLFAAFSIEEDILSSKSCEVNKVLRMETSSQNITKYPIQISANLPKGNSLTLDVDVGVTVSRDSLAPVFDLNNFNTIEDIRNFLQQEGIRRRASDHNCVTNKISEHEWIILKKRINSKLNSDNNRASVRAFKAALKDKL